MAIVLHFCNCNIKKIYLPEVIKYCLVIVSMLIYWRYLQHQHPACFNVRWWTSRNERDIDADLQSQLHIMAAGVASAPAATLSQQIWSFWSVCFSSVSKWTMSLHIMLHIRQMLQVHWTLPSVPWTHARHYTRLPKFISSSKTNNWTS